MEIHPQLGVKPVLARYLCDVDFQFSLVIAHHMNVDARDKPGHDISRNITSVIEPFTQWRAARGGRA